MALYLQMDGVDDYFLLPSMTQTEIRLEVDVTTGKTGVLYMAKSGNDLPEITFNGTTFSHRGLSSLATSPLNGRTEVVGTSASVWTANANSTIGKSSWTSSGFLQMKIYSIKFYNGATLVAHYDMSTGTVLDQSGNGKHATLAGGTWLDDGVGGGTSTNINVSSVIANAVASAIVPAITTQKQVTVSSVLANAVASAVAPTISTSSSVSATVTSTVASAVASMLAPSVGSFTHVTVVAVTPNATASGVYPAVSTIRNAVVIAKQANATASASIPKLVVVMVLPFTKEFPITLVVTTDMDVPLGVDTCVNVVPIVTVEINSEVKV